MDTDGNTTSPSLRAQRSPDTTRPAATCNGKAIYERLAVPDRERRRRCIAAMQEGSHLEFVAGGGHACSSGARGSLIHSQPPPPRNLFVVGILPARRAMAGQAVHGQPQGRYVVVVGPGPLRTAEPGRPARHRLDLELLQLLEHLRLPEQLDASIEDVRA